LELKKVEVKKREFAVEKANKQYAEKTDVEKIVGAPCSIECDGKRIAISIPIESPHLNSVLQAVKVIEYHKAARGSGIQSTSRIFGFKPRDHIRGPFCSYADLHTKQPKPAQIICNFADEIEKTYKKYFVDEYSHHSTVVETVREDYRMGESVFTSGIANYDNFLPYHYDRGNFNGVLSCMLCFTKGLEGGELLMPEYNIGISPTNQSLIIFDGQAILHGVAPFKIAKNGYRYTLVYYSLKQMWQCLTPDEELKYARTYRRGQLKKRAVDTEYKDNSDGRKKFTEQRRKGIARLANANKTNNSQK